MEIIIVDDEPVSLTALKQLLDKLPDCNVQSFTQASAALAWCKSNDPDLVIVGYVMPELNGIEFTEHFRALEGKADTPVLMVTATADRQVRNNAFQHGVNDFLNKPYDSVELQTRVGNLLMLRSGKKTPADHAPFRAEETSPKYPGRDRIQREGADGLLDVNMTLQRLAGDTELLGQVARVFIRTVPQLLTSISAALACNDVERAYAEAHSLKGAVAVFEAPDVLSSVMGVETHAINYNTAGAAAAFAVARTLVERLVTELSPMVPPDTER